MSDCIVGQPYDWAVGTSSRIITVRQPNQNNDYDDIQISVPQMEIRIFCIEYQTNRPFLVRVPYNNYCLVSVFERNHNTFTSWSEAEIGAIKQILIDQRGEVDRPLTCHEVQRKRLYNYDTNQYLMFECRFRDQKIMREFTKLNNEWHISTVGGGRYPKQLRFKTSIHEDNVDPILKFLIQYSPPHQEFSFGHASWIQVRGNNLPEHLRISTLDRELLFDECRPTLEPITEKSNPLANLYVIHPKYCGTWIASPKIMTFDLECQPENTNRFPIANLGDQIHMNSIVVQSFKQPHTRKVYYQIVGDCLPSQEFPSADIHRCPNEDYLINDFQDIIIYEDPDVILHYNGDSFDCRYLQDRLRCRGKQWRPITRLKGELPKLLDLSWESKQRGVIEVYELYMTGRPTFDVMQWIKAEHKLNLYNLDFVSRYFLTKPGQVQKKKISMKEMILTYDRVKQVWQQQCPLWKSQRKYTRPEQPSSEYIETLQDLQEYVEYTLADSLSTNDLFEHLGGWTVLSEFTGPLGLGARYLYRKGQTVKVLSQHYRIARNRCVTMIDRVRREGFKAKGGHVGHPKPGLVKFAFMVDFAAMYPSIMDEKNYDYMTYVPEGDTTVPDSMCNIIEAERATEDPVTKQITTKLVKHKFVKREVYRGIVPENVANLVATRNKVKKQLKAAKTDSEKQIFNARQLALKVAANSNFGYMLRPTGRYTFQEVGESITASGRKLILWCNDLLEKDRGYPIVYNDTDSSACTIPGLLDFKEGYKLAMQANDYINQKLREAHNGRDILRVEMEKAMRLLLLGPKFYCYFVINEDGIVEEDPGLSNCRGVPLARRDKPTIMNEIYRQQMFNIMIFQPIDYIYDLIYENLKIMIYHQLPFSMYTIIKKLGSKYANDSFSLAVFADELSKRGRPPQPGDRLTYLIVEGKGKQGYRSWLDEEYLEWIGWLNSYYNKDPNARDISDIENDRWLSIDIDYYLDLIKKQLDDVFEIVMAKRVDAYIARRPVAVALGKSARTGQWVYTTKLCWMSYNRRPVTAFIDFRKIKRKCEQELIKKVTQSNCTSSIIKLDFELNKIESITRQMRDLSLEFQKHQVRISNVCHIFNDSQRQQNQAEIEAELNDINTLIKDMWSWLPKENDNWVMQAYQALIEAQKLLCTPVAEYIDWNIWNRRYKSALQEWNYIGTYLPYCVQQKQNLLNVHYRLTNLRKTINIQPPVAPSSILDTWNVKLI